MGEAKRRKEARKSMPSRVCPVERNRCYDPSCQTACQRAQRPKGDPYMVEGSIGQPPLSQACRECPLRRTSLAGYLGGYTPESYIAIMHSDAGIACHMSPGFHERELHRQRHCTGIAAYRANVCKMPRAPGAAAAVRRIGVNREEFFATPGEFLAYHGG